MIVPRVPTTNPAGYVTEQVAAYQDGDGFAVPVAQDRPLPVQILASPRLVPLPFTGLDRIELSGAATASLSANFLENDDGSQTGLQVDLPASPTYANAAVVRRVLSGTVLGVRLSRSSLSAARNQAAPFGVTVDGEPIELDWSAQCAPESLAGTAVAGAYRNVVFGTFADGAHDVRLAIPCDATAARSVALLGWLVDEAAGYRAPPRGVSVQDLQATLTGTAKTFFGCPAGARGLLGFYYRNTDAAAQTLDVFAATTAFAGRLQRLTVASGADGYFALPGMVPDGIQLQPSAAGAFVITLAGAL